MKYLVLGLGITGISTVKTLSKLGYDVYGFDSKIKNEKDLPEELKGVDFSPIFNLEDLEDRDFICIKSPGIPVNSEIIKTILDKKIEVVSDLEMAYRLFGDKNLIAITGTNGKTTTTMLVNHILNESGKKSIAIGNIGIGMLWEIYSNPDIEFFVIESSSFQLESTKDFRTKVAAITNISPDHIDWHGNFENYFNAKKKVFLNQNSEDKLILNMDDEYLKGLGKEIKSKVITVSLTDKNRDFYYDKPFINHGNKTVLDTNKLNIPGLHNIQNTLIAAAITSTLGVLDEDIEKACYSFNSVEHRIEFVRDFNSVKFYNDSKGTNVDSTMKALYSFENPIILIAGGYDKKVSFKEMFLDGRERIKHLILMGSTAAQMKKEALEAGIEGISVVENMSKAVDLSTKIMDSGDIVLLSPACASWGMYNSYIERGNDFKNLVNNLNAFEN
ncbi:UDP-N-acetylmuramoyl-L-alanine--D-glutamate ligase [Lagierella sp.]|uniref:UDP-N-acetylmuramoyl-L-alanine--D-glutamate ligase n=1 Tax=Lagierella sp. TaxID=2849657 RepID=UPI002602A6A0|nr:UDP-N-acetylmuramoyl-L-alanine--D-glutamate ligase [Lagierella sp.]